VTKTKIARIVVASLVILVVVSGFIGKLNYGGICSLGTWDIWATNSLGFLLRSLDAGQIWATCPLGFLERSLAVGDLLPEWASVALVLVTVVLLGRVFCAWICPTVLLRRVFLDKGELKSKQQAAREGTNWASYSSYAVLGGVLAASFLFKFPIFCLFCPIGLFFGAFYAGVRFLSHDSPGLELVLFPAMLVLELYVLKSWCRSICPLGALLSIIGNFNRFLRPVVRQDKCLTGKGINCQACVRVCPEGIDLSKSSRFSPNSCTKCLECYDRCPAKAIEIRLWA
jgi:ferredoxin-type protein NapH